MSGIIVALDFPTLGEAEALAREVSADVAGFKVGLELLTGVGPSSIERIAALGKPVFADAKLHDIPNTVERAASRIAAAGARWLTVHASGGVDMMQAATSGMGGNGVLAVTVLTSIDDKSLPSLGVEGSVLEQVLRLAALAATSGAEGVVSSPEEAEAIKSAQPGLLLFTPGVRPSGAGPDDQRRVASPSEAHRAGADYLVIGRPITRASDPGAAAREIASSITRIA